MSVHVSSWAWKQKVGDASAKLVLMKLADNANDNGFAWPNRRTLSAETELSERTLVRKVQYLVDAGLIEARRRKRSSTIYVLKCQSVTSANEGLRSATVGVREPSVEEQALSESG